MDEAKKLKQAKEKAKILYLIYYHEYNKGNQQKAMIYLNLYNNLVREIKKKEK